MEYKDIRYEILLNSHPYYAKSYCDTSKRNLQECESFKYQYLQLWIWPDKSISEIMKLLPNISFRDVVELCLFYYPIPESVGKFDEISLFMNACKRGQDNPIIYISKFLQMKQLKGGIDEIWTTFDITPIGWICYYYNRIDIIDNIIDVYIRVQQDLDKKRYFETVKSTIGDLEIFRSMILIRDDPKAEIDDTDSIMYEYNFLISAIYLLSREELLEAVIILADKFDTKEVFNYLTGVDKVFTGTGLEFYSLIVNLIAFSDRKTIDQLLYKYYPDTEILNPRYQSPVGQGFWNTKGNNLDYHLHPELINNESLENQLIFHLTSGNYTKYIELKNRSVPMIIDKGTFLGANPVGYITFNREFQKYNNESNYITEFQQYQGIDLKVDINNPDTYLFQDPLSTPTI